ncbi:MAG: hypothetical protein FLDDKLPJ_02676 [Phycisphaerae bacterium]|nr:hypothetical protein [Phycisphaerae bacterium]
MTARRRFSFNTGPPILWRTSRRYLALAIACVLLAIGLAAWRYSRAPKLTAWQRYTILGLCVMPFVLHRIYGKLERRVRADWQLSGGRLCMDCGYRLVGLSQCGRCPECGAEYDLEADLKHWRDAGFDRPSSDGTEAPDAETRP